MNFDMIPDGARRICAMLGACGHEAYLVGGCVRDMLMGREPNDWDITTDALPEQMKECFINIRTIDTGIKHGTITVVLDGACYEVTTYRVDGKYEDNRRPSEVFFTDKLRDDLSRRDFTINATAYSEGRGVVDVFGGREDIARRIVRCVGEPDLRFGEDGLRILRALRFASVLDFEIDAATGESIHKNRTLLGNISAERIRDEFFKLICGAGAERIMSEYSDVICEFIPELAASVGFDQQNKYHAHDVFVHSLKAMAAVKGDLYVKLALLFHDIGKPASFTKDESGGHFYGHPELSAEMTETILRRLRADGATVTSVALLVREHHTVITNNERGVRRLLAALGEKNTRRLLEVRRGDNSALIPELKEPRTGEIAETERLLGEILAKDCCLSLRSLAIGGDDLIALGMQPGRQIGKTLARLLSAVIDGELENERETLLAEAGKAVNSE